MSTTALVFIGVAMVLIAGLAVWLTRLRTPGGRKRPMHVPSEFGAGARGAIVDIAEPIPGLPPAGEDEELKDRRAEDNGHLPTRPRWRAAGKPDR